MRLYLVVFAVGFAGLLGYIELPAGLKVLQHPWVIGAAGILLLMEFLADKVPGIDSVWDALHTFIRIPAGALLAAGATGDTLSALTVAAGLLGGTITAGTHFTKAGGRAMLNASPEPISNWAASFTEDAMVLAGIWFAFQYPVAFLAALVGRHDILCESDDIHVIKFAAFCAMYSRESNHAWFGRRFFRALVLRCLCS